MKKNIEKYLDGKLSNSKQKELLTWIRENENKENFNDLKKEWWSQTKNKSLVDLNATRLQNTIQEKNINKRKSILLNIYRYAAMVLLVLSVGVSLVYMKSVIDNLNPKITELTTDNGQISRVLLPDSTHVWINSGTKLVYDSQYGIKNRSLKIFGEAYFSVTKNQKIPFIVDAGKVKVKVTGTKFNVSNYTDQQHINIVLEEGAVDLLSPNNSFVTDLSPSEMLSLNKELNTYEKKKVRPTLYTSWKEGILSIYELPLNVIAIKLEKRYNQVITVDKRIESLPLTFSIEDQTLEEVIKIIEKISPVKSIPESGKIKLMYKPKK